MYGEVQIKKKYKSLTFVLTLPTNAKNIHV